MKYLFLYIFTFFASHVIALSPFYYFGDINHQGDEAIEKVKNIITQNGFNIIGEYSPANDENLWVIAFTNPMLINETSKIEERGLLASIYKVALINLKKQPELYLLNPEYIYHAYLGKNMQKTAIANPLLTESEKIKTAFQLYTNHVAGYGGMIDKEDLKDYRYMIGMPRFNDPVTLNTYESFSDGVATIRENLKTNRGNSQMVFEVVNEDEKAAVFGVGLNSINKGEPFFLPIVGKKHAAALPYEIVLKNNKATMLHGRYRIALHWPELTMVTFSKIMKTPTEIENQLRSVTKNH